VESVECSSSLHGSFTRTSTSSDVSGETVASVAIKNDSDVHLSYYSNSETPHTVDISALSDRNFIINSKHMLNEFMDMTHEQSSHKD